MDDQKTDHVAQRKTTRITHKELMATVCVAKDVVTPKRHEDSQRTDGQQGVNILHADKEDHAQDRQGDATQTGGQAIDTVYQVNGVRDIHHDKDRDGDPHPRGTEYTPNKPPKEPNQLPDSTNNNADTIWTANL